MFHVESYCPICGAGSIGFWRCADTRTLVLMCDECDSLWLNPEKINARDVIYASAPGFIIPNLECRLNGDYSGWASREEIEARGWVNHIAGEGKALNE